MQVKEIAIGSVFISFRADRWLGLPMRARDGNLAGTVP
jgi:hypothetical protein